MTQIIGVYDKPKTARHKIDTVFSINTKNKWKKDYDGSRFYTHKGATYYITEWPVVYKDKEKK